MDISTEHKSISSSITHSILSIQAGTARRHSIYSIRTQVPECSDTYDFLEESYESININSFTLKTVNSIKGLNATRSGSSSACCISCEIF